MKFDLEKLKDFFISFLDYVYKKRCYFCRSSNESVPMCSKCYDEMEFLNFGKLIAILGVSVYCAGYYNKNLQKLIRAIKYHNRKDLVYYQAKFMYEYWQNLGIEGDFTVIPVPLHKNRQSKRGYNHMELVAEEFCRLTGYTLNTDFILRIKDTKPQYKLNPKERAENLAGAFAIAKGVKIGGKILLMDDICTTGSTFTEMVKTLKNHGINDIVCFATTAVKF